MSQSGYNISDLVKEAQFRWLKPAEVHFILQNHEEHMITNEPPQKPSSGSLFLFNKRVLRFFRRDGHSWRRKKDGRTVGEAHERLKVGSIEALNCYYAHGQQDSNFQRRSYWMLDPAYEHIVLVHYRDLNEICGRNNVASSSQFSPASSLTFNQSPSSYTTQQNGSSTVIAEAFEQRQSSSPGSVEISSDPVTNTDEINYLGSTERTQAVGFSSGLEISQALRRLEEQLSLNDDCFEEIDPLYTGTAEADDLDKVMSSQGLSAPVIGCSTEQSPQFSSHEVIDWKYKQNGFSGLCDTPQGRHIQESNENGVLLSSLNEEQNSERDSYTTWISFGGSENQEAKEVGNFRHPTFNSNLIIYGNNSENFTMLFDQAELDISLENELNLTVSHTQKFTIREISPEWGYASEATKVLIIGSFLCDPSESTWTCMFGDVEVPANIIQEGVICCISPAHLPGKVTLSVASGNRQSCSNVREFEYHDKPGNCLRCSHPETEARTSEEMLMLVRFVQLLLSSDIQKVEGSSSKIDLLEKSRACEDLWDQVIEALLVGSSTSFITTDWLLQELLKDKLHNWLLSRSHEESGEQDCALSKKEQGIIHMVAGLGFEWALQPILNSGVGVNVRDINGWTALHWAARFGREKMVAEFIAAGASAGAVTDPNPQDPTGKTAAAIAATFGHQGLAGYLSEVALTSHLSSLTLEESELSKGCADVEAERTVNSVPRTSPTTSEDQLSLKDTLAAVRNAAQAAARIQSAFRAHSFRRRQQREALVTASSADMDEYGMSCSDIWGLSSASKMAFRHPREYNSAALSIQKKYRGWMGRRDFLSLRQKVVKIQAHVRGYQVRKNYKVCWAVGILEKVVLRWRRGGAGLRGFRQDTEPIDEVDDEDILRVFRKQKVDAALDEAVSRVLSMVESPEARQQYHRILEKYRQAKAEHDKEESTTSAISFQISSMENDDLYQLA